VHPRNGGAGGLIHLTTAGAKDWLVTDTAL